MALSVNLSPEKIGKILDVVNGMSPAEVRALMQKHTGFTASDDEIKKALDFLNKHKTTPLTDADLESAAGGLCKGGKKALAAVGGAVIGSLVTIGGIAAYTYAQDPASKGKFWTKLGKRETSTDVELSSLDGTDDGRRGVYYT